MAGGTAFSLNFRVADPSMLFEGSEGLVFPLLAVRRSKCMACFYEIRNSNNAVLTHHGGFPTQDAAKAAGRADAKKMKNSRQPDRSDVGRIMVGQNTQPPTRLPR